MVDELTHQEIATWYKNGKLTPHVRQMAELFAVTKMSISLHIANILKENELEDSVVKFFFTTAIEDESKKQHGK